MTTFWQDLANEKKQREKFQQCRQEVNRIDWTEHFILQAYLVSTRSLDAQTQCGCIITKPNHTIISSGYNSFIRDIDDSVLPNLRPLKYSFMIHAEHNALLSCAKNGVSTDGCYAYITTFPCLQCFQYLHQAGISKIHYYNNSYVNMTDNAEYHANMKILKNLSSIEIIILPETPEFSEKISRIQSCRA